MFPASVNPTVRLHGSGCGFFPGWKAMGNTLLPAFCSFYLRCILLLTANSNCNKPNGTGHRCRAPERDWGVEKVDCCHQNILLFLLAHRRISRHVLWAKQFTSLGLNHLIIKQFHISLCTHLITHTSCMWKKPSVLWCWGTPTISSGRKQKEPKCSFTLP